MASAEANATAQNQNHGFPACQWLQKPPEAPKGPKRPPPSPCAGSGHSRRIAGRPPHCSSCGRSRSAQRGRGAAAHSGRSMDGLSHNPCHVIFCGRWPVPTHTHAVLSGWARRNGEARTARFLVWADLMDSIPRHARSGRARHTHPHCATTCAAVPPAAVLLAL